MNRILIGLSGFLLVLLVVSVSLGQGLQHAAKATSRDEAAIHDYILTMDEVNKYAAVSKKMQAAAGDDSAMAAEMKKIEDTDVDVMEKADLMEKAPHTAAFLRANRVTAREIVLVPMTAVTAGMANAALDLKGKPPAFVNPVNMQFVRDHKAELEKLDIGGSGDSKHRDSANNSSDDKDPEVKDPN
jgi:hypothetical protein